LKSFQRHYKKKTKGTGMKNLLVAENILMVTYNAIYFHESTS
jgi:hypothetical protein